MFPFPPLANAVILILEFAQTEIPAMATTFNGGLTVTVMVWLIATQPFASVRETV